MLDYPREIELKIDVDDIPVFIRTLEQAGAVREYERARIIDYYYGLGERRVDFGGILSLPVRVDSVKEQDRGRLDQALSYLGLRVKEHIRDRKGDMYIFERPSRIPRRHIRFRTSGDSTSMTVKGRRTKEDRGRVDNRVEIEIPIASTEEFEKLFEKIGYKKGHSEVKLRSAYRLGKAVIEINELPERGGVVYIEIEASSQDILVKTATTLGIRQDQLLGGLSLNDYLEHLKAKKAAADDHS